MNTKVMFSSEDQTWNTPKNVLELVRSFGDIGLDPCSNASSIVDARASCDGIVVDGLKTSWSDHGLVYVNPPYAREISQWMRKCELEAVNGAEIIALVPARVDTEWWFNSVATGAQAVAFFRGRIKFRSANGQSSNAAPFPSALVYYGPQVDRFASVFSNDCWIVRL